jgi:hypothetical protein
MFPSRESGASTGLDGAEARLHTRKLLAFVHIRLGKRQ